MVLRCFVAMALGREDTDKVYDALISPTLRKKGVTPIRIDRIEHNDDIDDRIIFELQTCDFALADLTYARPSVYFEAGFAERNLPVIYTCRKDHLSTRSDDTYGNLRVHFDLQMKNIIHWTSPSDHKFAEKLARRISRVIAPLLRIKKTEQIEKQEAEEFAKLSLREKIERVLDTCVSRLKRNGYSKILSEKILISPIWLGKKYEKGKFHLACVYLTPNLTKNDLNYFLLSYISQAKKIYEKDKKLKVRSLKQLIENYFICSLQKAPVSRFTRLLPIYRLDQKHNVFTWIGKKNLSSDKKTIEVPSHVHVHLLDNIKSERDFGSLFSNVLKGA